MTCGKKSTTAEYDLENYITTTSIIKRYNQNHYCNKYIPANTIFLTPTTNKDTIKTSHTVNTNKTTTTPSIITVKSFREPQYKCSHNHHQHNHS